MKNNKPSLTFKVVAGYLLVAALAGIALWFIYSRVISFSNIAQYNSNNNEKLFLVGEITTGLYETENMSRRLIQSGNNEDLDQFRVQIDSIKENIAELRENYSDSLMQSELDSISALLSRKTANMEELTKLREQDRNTNYYARVIEELKKVDESFALGSYEERFSDLEPHQRRVLIQLLQYAEEDNAQTLTNRTADSLIGSVKNVLTELEFANRQFRNKLNEKENELLENDMILNQQLRKLLAQIERDEREAALARADTSQKMLRETSDMIIAAGVVSLTIILVFLVLIIRDVTRSQRYRKQLEEAKTLAESLLKSREQFMTAITHDLRSPLNTVIGYTELMHKTPLNNKQKHYLEQLKKSSDFILHLVNDLLDLSKLEAGKMLVEKLPFNPKKLIEDTVYNSIGGRTNKNLEINIETSEDLNVQVLSDPFRIKQILSNLVTNAYKFTEEGEIRIKAILKKEIEDSYCLLISVKDTGIGISQEKQEDIFEEFSQESNKIEKLYGGSGLGLTITKSLTELLKGEINLKSERGKGSEFIIAIPVVKLPDEVEPQVIKKVSPPDLTGKKALVVDDETSQLALSVELVKSIGMKADSSTNGREAIDKLNDEKYDLILTDIQMPGTDGFELIKEIRQNNDLKEIPVIAISGRTDVDSEVYKRAGFTDNLLKPYKPAELLSKIATIFRIEISAARQKPAKQKNSSSTYNLEDIYMFSGGDEEAMQIIVKAFLESSKQNLESMERASAQQDDKELGRIAHKMLPMIKQLKATPIIGKLESLEAHQKLSHQEVLVLIAEIRTLMRNLEEEITV